VISDRSDLHTGLVHPPKLPIIRTLAAKCEQIYSDIFERIKKTFHKTFVAIGIVLSKKCPHQNLNIVQSAIICTESMRQST
jgi:hypothetical protein